MSRTDGLYGAVQRRLIKEMFKFAASDNKRNILRAFAVAEKIAPDNHKYEVRFVKEKVEQDHPALGISRHVLGDLSPTCRDGFINGFVVNSLLRGSQKRQDFAKKTGLRTPFTVIVSPTMRCNLSCEGCYASKYSTQSDMPAELFQRVVDEAAEMGVYLITVLGGEPFIRGDLLDVVRCQPRHLLPDLQQRHAGHPRPRRTPRQAGQRGAHVVDRRRRPGNRRAPRGRHSQRADAHHGPPS